MKNQILFLVRLMIVYLLLVSFHQLSAKAESEEDLSIEMGVNRACKQSIQGPPGPTGPRGPTGARGATGATGATGTANPLTSFMNAYFATSPPALPQTVAIGSSIIFNNHTTSSDGAISFTNGTTTFTFNKAGVYEITFGADPAANGIAAGLVLVRNGTQLPGTSYTQLANSTMQEMSTIQTFASGDTLQVTYEALANSGSMVLNDTQVGGVTAAPVGAFIVITFLRPSL